MTANENMNGQAIEENPIKGWGAVHCVCCETPLAWFPPETGGLDEDAELELFCFECAKKEGGNKT